MEEKEFDNIESLAAFLHSGADKPESGTSAEKPKQEVSASVKHSAPKRRPVPQPHNKPVKAEEAIRESAPQAEKKQRVSDEDLSEVLFSIESKKKQPPATQAVRHTDEASGGLPAKTAAEKTPYRKASSAQPERKKSSQFPADDDENEPFHAENAKPEKGMIHYDNAATQMVEIGAVRASTSRTAEIAEENDEDEEDDRRSRREISEIRRRYERQRQRSRTFAYILLGAFLCVVIVGVSAYFSTHIVTFALDMTGIAPTEFELDIVIPDGATTDVVGAILQENNIIKSAKFFKEFADFTGKKDSYYPGTYTLSSTMSYMTIFKTLQSISEDKKTVTIRISEGMTAKDIGNLLEENKVCYASDFEAYYKTIQNNYDFERRLSTKSSKFNQLEGYLFPDTYEFYAVLDTEKITYESKEEQDKAEAAQREKEIENAEDAAKKMYKNFNDKITKVMYKQMGEMNMTLDEVITLASMVQKEAASVEDMYYVASVFLNRIRSSEEFPYLQSDVTTLYVENDIKPFVTDTSRLRRYSDAYNTYICNGIPAGPICSPGLDAINAVLNSAETNYYYFCANEETGEVFYATTHDEHEANLIRAGLTEAQSEIE